MLRGINKSVFGLFVLGIFGLILGLTTSICDAKSGTEEVYGDLYIAHGQRLEIGGEGMDVYDSIFNRGTVFIGPFKCFWAEHQFVNSSLIEMFNGDCTSHEVFKNLETGEIKGCGALSSGEVHNQGFLHSFGGPLLVGSGAGFSNSGILANGPGTTLTIWAAVPFVNNLGKIEASSNGTVVFDCNLVNEPNGVVKLLGGTLAANTVTQKADAILEGFGGITGNLVIEPNALVKLTGPTNIVGDVNISENAILEISDGTVLITGRTTCNSTIHLKGGQIVSQGGLSGNYNIIREPSISIVIADINND